MNKVYWDAHPRRSPLFPARSGPGARTSSLEHASKVSWSAGTYNSGDILSRNIALHVQGSAVDETHQAQLHSSQHSGLGQAPEADRSATLRRCWRTQLIIFGWENPTEIHNSRGMEIGLTAQNIVLQSLPPFAGTASVSTSPLKIDSNSAVWHELSIWNAGFFSYSFGWTLGLCKQDRIENKLD